MHKPSIRVATLACLSLLVAQSMACSGKEGRAMAPVHGRLDAGAERDAETTTMKPTQEQDAGQHVISSGGTELCTYQDSDRFMLAQGVRSNVLSSASSPTGFGVVYQRNDGALFVNAVGRSGAVKAAVAVTTAKTGASAPMLLSMDGKFLLAYRKADALVTRDLDDADSLPQTLSDALVPAADGGEPWALVAGESGYVASWWDTPKAPVMRVAALDPSGKLIGTPSKLPELARRKPDGLGLARMESGELLLAWRQEDDAKLPAVYGQLLSSKLDVKGSQAQLSKTPASPGAFGVAARADSAGLLYPGLDGGARQALKLRRIATSGTPDGPILNVADAPRVVYGGSIAAYGRGYVLVYRELPSIGRPQAEVRIAFIDPFGTVVYDSQLADVSEMPAATSVSAGDDDHIMISFIDAGPQGAFVHALRMECPGALVLCGGSPD